MDYPFIYFGPMTNQPKICVHLLMPVLCSSCKRSFNSQKPNSIKNCTWWMSKFELRNRFCNHCSHWSWEIGCIWHFLRKSGDIILSTYYSITVILTRFKLLHRSSPNLVEITVMLYWLSFLAIKRSLAQCVWIMLNLSFTKFFMLWFLLLSRAPKCFMRGLINR